LNWCDEWYKYKYGGATLEDPHLRTDNWGPSFEDSDNWGPTFEDCFLLSFF
jgi:hypothetical protein